MPVSTISAPEEESITFGSQLVGYLSVFTPALVSPCFPHPPGARVQSLRCSKWTLTRSTNKHHPLCVHNPPVQHFPGSASELWCGCQSPGTCQGLKFSRTPPQLLSVTRFQRVGVGGLTLWRCAWRRWWLCLFHPGRQSIDPSPDRKTQATAGRHSAPHLALPR